MRPKKHETTVSGDLFRARLEQSSDNVRKFFAVRRETGNE